MNVACILCCLTHDPLREKNEKEMKRILITVLLAAVTCATAQVTVEATIDTIEMRIGEQAHVQLKVVAPESANVAMPLFAPRQEIISGVEVVSSSEENNVPLDDGLVQHTVSYTLTSFDGQLYYLPPFKVNVDGKEYESKSLAVKVLEIDVDTVNIDKFYGPWSVQDNPFEWSDWSEAFWLSVLMLLLGAGGAYLYVRLRADKPIISHIRIVKRLLPHQKAMKEIEQIKANKMVQSDNQKEYYTKLTDTLRKYIEERYGFKAMEMTSGQIIERLMSTADAVSLNELRTLFQTADLVKFAKYSTLINENDMNLVNAIEFINSTKIENMPTEEVQRPQLSKEQVRSVKERRVLKVTIGLIAFVCIALLAYVIFSMYQLLG